MKFSIFIILLIILFVTSEASDDVLRLMKSAGYEGESYQVTTEDGYILTLHRVLPAKENRKKFPVFLMHGIFANAADFFIAGPKVALPFLLADNGYDVWMGNARGSKHSPNHKVYSSNSNEFWNFSWHEIGLYDLPAMIDFMLKQTKTSRTFYIGHSQGTTEFLVMLSTRPEYNDKIIQAHLMAPAAFMKNQPNPLTRLLGEIVDLGFFNGYTYVRIELILDWLKELGKILCIERQRKKLSFCEGIIFSIAGANRNGVEMSQVNITNLIC